MHMCEVTSGTQHAGVTRSTLTRQLCDNEDYLIQKVTKWGQLRQQSWTTHIIIIGLIPNLSLI